MCWAYQPLLTAASQGGGAYRVAADAGSFQQWGRTAYARAARRIAASAGASALTGNEVRLKRGFVFIADAGALAVAAPDVRFIRSRRIAPAAAEFHANGYAAAPEAVRVLYADAGSTTLSGTAIMFRQASAFVLNAGAAGSFGCLGQPCGLAVIRRLAAAGGAILVHGQSAIAGTAILTQERRPANLGISLGL